MRGASPPHVTNYVISCSGLLAGLRIVTESVASGIRHREAAILDVIHGRHQGISGSGFRAGCVSGAAVPIDPDARPA